MSTTVKILDNGGPVGPSYTAEDTDTDQALKQIVEGFIEKAKIFIDEELPAKK